MDVKRVIEKNGLQNSHGQYYSTCSNPEKKVEKIKFKCWQLCFWEIEIDWGIHFFLFVTYFLYGAQVCSIFCLFVNIFFFSKRVFAVIVFLLAHWMATLLFYLLFLCIGIDSEGVRWWTGLEAAPQLNRWCMCLTHEFIDLSSMV